MFNDKFMQIHALTCSDSFLYSYQVEFYFDVTENVSSYVKFPQVSLLALVAPLSHIFTTRGIQYIMHYKKHWQNHFFPFLFCRRISPEIQLVYSGRPLRSKSTAKTVIFIQFVEIILSPRNMTDNPYTGQVKQRLPDLGKWVAFIFFEIRSGSDIFWSIHSDFTFLQTDLILSPPPSWPQESILKLAKALPTCLYILWFGSIYDDVCNFDSFRIVKSHTSYWRIWHLKGIVYIKSY